MLKNDHLPLDAYINPEFFNLEQEHIFSTTWSYAALIEDIKEPGQFKTVQAGLNNIIIMMGQDYRLRAFHNICRHRGTQLLRAEGKVNKALICPYHDWSYDLEGDLLSLPKEQEEFDKLDKTSLGLKKASLGCWRGMVWVHPEPNAAAISDWLSQLEPHLGPHRVEELVESPEDKVVEVVNANWKIVVENYIDHYHLAQLHSGTLNMYNHKQAEFGFIGKHFAFWEPLEVEYASNIKANSPLPLIDHIPKELLGAWVPMMFPGIGLSETESSWSDFHIIPLSVDRTRVEIRTKVMPSSDYDYLKQGLRSAKFWHKRIGAKYSSIDKKHPLGSGNFMQEDIYVCEQQQKSLSSPFYEQGPSAQSGEAPIRKHRDIIWQLIAPHWNKRRIG